MSKSPTRHFWLPLVPRNRRRLSTHSTPGAHGGSRSGLPALHGLHHHARLAASVPDRWAPHDLQETLERLFCCPSIPAAGFGRTSSQASYLTMTTRSSAPQGNGLSNSLPPVQPRSPFLWVCKILYHGPLYQTLTSWHGSPEAAMPTSFFALFPTTSGPPHWQTQLGFSIPPTVRCERQQGRPTHPHSLNVRTMKTRKRQQVRP